MGSVSFHCNSLAFKRISLFHCTCSLIVTFLIRQLMWTAKCTIFTILLVVLFCCNISFIMYKKGIKQHTLPLHVLRQFLIYLKFFIWEEMGVESKQPTALYLYMLLDGICKIQWLIFSVGELCNDIRENYWIHKQTRLKLRIPNII